MLLTDEEIIELSEQLTWYDADVERIDPIQFARSVIAAYEAKLREQNEPAGYLHKSKDDNSWDHLDFDSYDDEYGKAHWDSYPIYLHPAPIPEGWISVEDRLPDEEIPVLIIFNGEIVIGERRWDNPGFEDTYKAFWYWDDPTDDGQDWGRDEVTHWMPLPKPPMAAARSGE